MNGTGKTIAKNATVLMASQLITWSLTLALMVYLPRILGATAVGQFHLANSIWAMAGVFATFGMDTYLVKAVARRPEKLSEVYGAILIFRAVIFSLTFGFVALYVQFAGYEVETVTVIFIIGISGFFLLLTGTSRAALEGLERMEYVSLSDIISKTFLTVVGLVLLFLGKGILVISAVVVTSSIIGLFIQRAYLKRLHPIHIKFDWQVTKKIIRESFPYFLVSVFAVVYIQLDIVIISLLAEEEVVGWYGAADGLFATLMFIPSIFMTAVFPALTRLHADSSEDNGENDQSVLSNMMGKSFDFLMLLSVPIGLGVMVIATPVVLLLFGDELINSGPVLSVMGIVLILTYQNMLLGSFIISVDRQKILTIIMAVATAATIPLDLLLVPWCQEAFGNGAIGGSLAFIITEGGMMIAGLYVLPKGLLGWSNVWTTVRIFIAGLVMVTAVWFLQDIFIAVPIIVGGIVYIAMILLLRVIPQEDLLLLRGVAERILNRVLRRETESAG